jgi:DNA polymerase III epsilon subunit-like protein
MTEITLDLETLGTRPGCAILSIGAVAHVPGRPVDEMESFYRAVNLASCVERGLTIDLETIAWWQKQDDLARRAAFAGTDPLEDVLVMFAAWLKSVESAGGVAVYGKGPSFDCAIVAAACWRTGQALPWRYSQERCVRTVLAEAARLLGKEAAEALIVKPVIAHHALHDARAEMETLIALRSAVDRKLNR